MIEIVEVGPRDGLQNETAIVPTQIKLELIKKLVLAGLERIEITSCVSPKAVPQMADCIEVIAGARPKPAKGFSALVPNERGMRNLVEADQSGNVDEIAVFTAASETFVQKNIHCSIAESLARFESVAKHADATKRRLRGYVSTAIACPYEGKVDPGKVEQVAQGLVELGCVEISLGDTIGAGKPETIKLLVSQVAKSVSVEHLAIHCHDTYDGALGNIAAAIERGVCVVDASVGGLGGCPYAPGAKGNVATEEVVDFLNKLGVKTTGVVLAEIKATGSWIRTLTGLQPLQKKAYYAT